MMAMTPFERDRLLFDSGVMTGLLFRYSVEEWQELADDNGLYLEFQRHVKAFARLRKELEGHEATA